MLKISKQYENLQKENVIFFFKGEVSFDLVKSILDIMESRFDIVEKNPATKKKIFNVLVEVLQNLSHHIESAKPGEDIIDEGKTAIFQIWSENDSYHISTGNFIPSNNVDNLQRWLVYINSTTDEELRALYKEKLNDKFTPKGGGGLGFIDIARKSGQKLVYSFDKINSEYSFFSFEISIPKVN